MSPEVTSTVDLLIRNAYVITMDEQRRVYTDGFVAANEGKIVGVGRSQDCAFQGREEIDAAGYVLLPGLINAHNHLVQIAGRGSMDGPFPSGRGLPQDMRERMKWVVARGILNGRSWDEERTYHLVRLHLLEMIKGGTVATHDQHFTNLRKDSIDGVLRAIDESGMRAFVARATVNAPGMIPEEAREEPEVGLQEVERLRARWNSPRIEVVPSPLGVNYIRSGDDIVTLKRGAEVMGARFEMELCGNTGPKTMQEWGWDGGVIEYLDHIGVLDESVLGDKGHLLQDQEYQLWKDRGLKVCMVPTLRIMDGQGLPAARFLELGIMPGMGTDAMVTPNSGLWRVMRYVVFAQRLLDIRQQVQRPTGPWGYSELMLEMATRGGAWALFMDDRTGSLEVGKDADCILIDTRRVYLHPTAQDRRLVSNLVWAGETDMVDTVIVAGKILMRNRECLVWNEEKVIQQAEATLAQIHAETGEDQALPRRVPGGNVRGWSYL